MDFSARKSSEIILPLAAFALLNCAGYAWFRLPFPDPSTMRLGPEDAVQTASLLSIGMRRLAADVDFIQLLMYYGTPLTKKEAHEREHESGHDHMADPLGSYPELKIRTERMLDLDPYFEYPALFTAGALAFNLQRPEEALAVLEKASRYLPKDWKLRAYIAAIGFHKQGNGEEVIRELTPLLRDPDCPTMLKHLLAFLNQRAGHRDEAIRIYRDILNSRDPSYVELARKSLRALHAD